MTEEIFEQLDFKRIDVPIEESGSTPFYYYILDIGDVCLITNADDEAKKDGWIVEIFESRTAKFTNPDDLKDLVRVLKNNTVEQ